MTLGDDIPLLSIAEIKEVTKSQVIQEENKSEIDSSDELIDETLAINDDWGKGLTKER